MSSRTPRTRRTQAQRTAETRRALLDATFDSLVQVGFKATTTTEVAHRASVSLGALLHHFPTKADLLTAAVVHSYARTTEEFRLLMAALDPSADKVDSAIDLLWSLYASPTFTAWTELWVASRTDPELAAAVVHLDEQSMTDSAAIYADLFPAHDPPAVQIGLHLTYALFKGLAISGSIDGYQPHPTAAVLEAFKTMIRPLLTPTTTSTAHRTSKDQGT